MAKFKFDLQAVLVQRMGVERQKQLAVAALERERLGLEGVIREHQAEMVREKLEMRAALEAERRGEAVSLRDARFQASAALRSFALAQQAVLKLAGLHRRIDAARLELLEATTRRKAVEVLRERRYEEWMQEQKRREGAAADEMNVMHAARASEGAREAERSEEAAA